MTPLKRPYVLLQVSALSFVPSTLVKGPQKLFGPRLATPVPVFKFLVTSLLAGLLPKLFTVMIPAVGPTPSMELVTWCTRLLMVTCPNLEVLPLFSCEG